jgi:cytochrome d ubiquinol oxidase subunit I
MRTVQAHSELVNPGDVVFTLLGFAGLYLLLGNLFVVQVLKEINHGPSRSH